MMRMQETRIDSLFYALSDRSRRQMISQLSREGRQTVTRLGRPLGLTKQAVSKHLFVLEEAGFVTKKKEGREQLCTLNPAALEAIRQVVAQYEAFWGRQLDGLEKHIEQLNAKGKKP